MQLQNWQRVLSNFAPIFLNWSCLALARKRPAHLAGIRKLVYTQHTHTHMPPTIVMNLWGSQPNNIIDQYSPYTLNIEIGISHIPTVYPPLRPPFTHRLPHFPHPLHPPQTHFWRGHMLYTASLLFCVNYVRGKRGCQCVCDKVVSACVSSFVRDVMCISVVCLKCGGELCLV